MTTAVLAVVLALLSPPLRADAPACELRILSVEAARGDARPDSGWQAVTLPDDWSRRWPDHDGSVWYRLALQLGCPADPAPAAVIVHSTIMASEVFFNDDPLWRDPHMTEPLSRSWNMPRLWVLPESARRVDGNVLWVRVAGVSQQTPGLGKVSLGSPQAMQERHRQDQWRTRTLPLINLVVSAVLGVMALFIWVAFRSQTTFGWYALTALSWVLFGTNTLATVTWPFADTESVARANTLAYLLFITSFCIFSWRLLGLRHRRWQALVLAVPPLASVVLTLLPGWAGMKAAGHIATLCFLLNGVYLIGRALCIRDKTHWIAAGAFLALIGIALRDALTLRGVIISDVYLTPYSCLLFMLMAAIVLGARVASDARRIRRFNQHLSDSVEQACAELSLTLDKEHRLALSNSRLQERLRLAHDLHDGLGGQIARSIMMIEQQTLSPSKERTLSMFKLLRDDLRQVIDSDAGANAAPPATPKEWVAPLRYRFANLFDELNIGLRWQIAERWRHTPSALQCLLLARIVEEALTNVAKHSRARQAQVTQSYTDTDELLLRITDDGIGFDIDAVGNSALGVGISSMRARTERLGGTLTLYSGTHGTTLEARLPTTMTQRAPIVPDGKTSGANVIDPR